MGKVLKQFRYYGDSDPNELNYPADIKKENLQTGAIFFNTPALAAATIASLGIQTIPGIKFYLNDAVDPIIVGSTGIYELNLTDNYEISALRFEGKSLDLIGSYNGDAYLIIDIVYNTEEWLNEFLW